MGSNDHAIVVGIGKYPLLTDLDGPENDARDFEQWLLDPRGGNVPQANVHVVLSTFPPPPAAAPYKARPQVSEIIDLFDDLYAAGDAAGAVGDRLYLYLAGHGFAKDIDSAALLMANAAKGAVAGRHLPGRPYANYFREAAFFRDVVLFMDCCRESYVVTSMAGVPYDPRVTANPGRRFFGFATKWSHAAREIQTQNGVVRGVFTLALLAGLRGGASADANGQIKGSDLESYVINYISNLRPNDDDGPEFDYNKAADLLFNPPAGEAPCNVQPAAAAPHVAQPPQTYRIRIRPQNGASNLDLIVTDGAFNVVAPETKSPQEWTWRIPDAGMYKVKRSDGASQIVEVIGDQEVIDVVL